MRDHAMVRSEESYAGCAEKQLLVSCARTRMVPEIAERIRFHIPDEKEKRHGQAIAAASLPAIPVQEKTHATS